MTRFFVLIFSCLSMVGALQAHWHGGGTHVHTNVSVNVGGGWGHHNGWYHDRVYYTDPVPSQPCLYL